MVVGIPQTADFAFIECRLGLRTVYRGWYPHRHTEKRWKVSFGMVASLLALVFNIIKFAVLLQVR